MMRMSEAQWDAVIAVNLKSAFNFIHACTPIMMRQKGGSIINMASVVGVHGNAGQANYSASKAGMIGLAKSIAQELGMPRKAAEKLPFTNTSRMLSASLWSVSEAIICPQVSTQTGTTASDSVHRANPHSLHSSSTTQ